MAVLVYIVVHICSICTVSNDIYMHEWVIVDGIAQQIMNRRVNYTHNGTTPPKNPTGRVSLRVNWDSYLLGREIPVMENDTLGYQSLMFPMCHIAKLICTILVLTKKNSSYNLALYEACLE